MLAALTAVLIGVFTVWFQRNGLSPRLDKAFPVYNRGNAPFAKGNYDAAITEFRKVVALKPDSAGAQNNLGIALDTMRKKAEAVREFQEAHRLNPN